MEPKVQLQKIFLAKMPMKIRRSSIYNKIVRNSPKYCKGRADLQKGKEYQGDPLKGHFALYSILGNLLYCNLGHFK